ncbi:unnamed protein product [Cuscuta campestris]|uniref:AAA+ ATPase domain-containing protein n=1 Tax=Cuscuta campestris TaxID=132261 RepID=A0A484NCF9_9ASTE|nr:unnamed protein product [Cuscuta campestris]
MKMAGTASSSETIQTKMEEEKSELCWRKEVDINLKRLQSLVFGAEKALERQDFSSAQVLTLGLIGFLDSRSNSDIDEAFIRPIRSEALSNLDAARRNLIQESDRRAFEQAGKDPGRIFTKKGEIDIDKIKRSKYFQALLQNSEGIAPSKTTDRHTRQENLASKISKSPVPASYGDVSQFIHKASNKDNCPDILFNEKVRSNQNFRDHGDTMEIDDEEVEKPFGKSLKMKQLNMETFGQRNKNVKSPLCNEGIDTDSPHKGFVTARDKLEMDVRQRRGLNGHPSASESPQSDSTMANKSYGVKPYGNPRRGIRGNFVPPIRCNGNNAGGSVTSRNAGKGEDALEDSTRRCLEMLCGPDGELPEKLRNLEPRLIEHVSNEIMERDPNVRWNDIAGLEHAKKVVNEMVIYPLMRPDLFSGCRSPGRGLLLFGPPGTGKTMIGKAIAGEAKATFFYISASSLTSKWIGEGEKLVRALFGVASCRKPAVIFVDEIDSLLSQRKSEGEHESSRRLKTQFLIEMEGFDSGSDQILLIGATNRPQELDEAARRRLTKRLYIPLPSSEARSWIIQNLLEKDGLFSLSKEDIDSVCKLTEGYSGSDMKNLVKDASMGPLREVLQRGVEITKLRKEDIRPVSLQDFKNSLQEVRPSVSLNELGVYEVWNKQFGSLSL